MVKQDKFISSMNFGHGRINIFQNIIIAFILVMLFAMPLLFRNRGEDIIWDQIFRIWLENGLVLVVFFINRVILLPHLLLKNRIPLYIVTLISLIILSTLMLREIHPSISMHDVGPISDMRLNRKPDLGIPPRGRMIPPGFDESPAASGYHLQFGNFLILNILLLGFDLALFFSIRGISSEQSRIQIEKENVQMKMDFLKHQISPHFFMNTLNNIHALVDINTEETKSTIIKLSRLMGYMLYDSQTDKVELEKEFEFISSYVELMKLRYTDDVDIKVSMPKDKLVGNIPPLLTISFIENAFKYGVSYENNSHVYISYKVLNNRYYFYCENTIHLRPKSNPSQSGIGITNTINRLQLLYDKDYELDITDEEGIFTVKLNLPI